MPKKPQTKETKTVKVKRTSIGLEVTEKMHELAGMMKDEPGDFDENPTKTKRRHLRAVK